MTRPKALLFLMLLPKCPVCGEANVSAAHILGHGGKGKAKTITEEERVARAARMAAAQKNRWPKKKGKT